MQTDHTLCMIYLFIDSVINEVYGERVERFIGLLCNECDGFSGSSCSGRPAHAVDVVLKHTHTHTEFITNPQTPTQYFLLLPAFCAN